MVAFAKRLASLPVGQTLIAMRIAGDEFGLYLHNLDQVDDVLFASISLIGRCTRPNGTSSNSTGSIRKKI